MIEIAIPVSSPWFWGAALFLLVLAVLVRLYCDSLRPTREYRVVETHCMNLGKEGQLVATFVPEVRMRRGGWQRVVQRACETREHAEQVCRDHAQAGRPKIHPVNVDQDPT